MRNLSILLVLLAIPVSAQAAEPAPVAQGCPESFEVDLGRWVTGGNTLYVAGEVAASPEWDFSIDRRISLADQPGADLVVTLRPKRVRASGRAQVVRPVFAAWLYHDHPAALTSSTAVRVECGGRTVVRITHEPQSVPTRAPPPLPPLPPR